MKRIILLIAFLTLAALAHSTMQGPTTASINGQLDIAEPPYSADLRGIKDATTAINAACRTALTIKGSVYIPRGTFSHNNIIFCGVPMVGSGEASIIQSTDTSANPNLAIILQGVGAQLKNVKVTTTWTGGRINHTTASAVLVKGDKYQIDHVHIVGAGDMGIEVVGGTNGQETNNVVENTNADGINFSGCSHDDSVSNNTVLNNFDDAFSVNSYYADSCASHNISYSGNHAVNTAGHGLALVGGDHLSAVNTTVDGATTQGCLQIASVSVYGGMRPATNITVDGFQANNCLSGILIDGDTSNTGTKPNYVDTVSINNFVGTNIAGIGFILTKRLDADTGQVNKNIKVSNSSLTASQTAHSNSTTFIRASRDVTLTNNTFSGFGGYCLLPEQNNTNAGFLNLVGNHCDMNNLGNAPPDALHATATTGFEKVTVVGNTVKNGANPKTFFAH